MGVALSGRRGGCWGNGEPGSPQEERKMAEAGAGNKTEPGKEAVSLACLRPGSHVGIDLVTPRSSRGNRGKMALPVSWALSPSGLLPSWQTLANPDLPVQPLPVTPTSLI